MLAQFSYKNHFLIHLLKNSRELFPGATRVATLYYDKDSLGLKAFELDLQSEDQKIANLEFDSSIQADLEGFRKQRPRYSWMDKHLFSTTTRKDQLKIQGEFENHTLLIRFPNSGDGLSDLFMIFFKNEEQVFRISGKAQKLSTELKQSLASVYVRSLDAIRKQIENDLQIQQILTSYTKNKQGAEEKLSAELITNKKKQHAIYASIAERFSKQFDQYGEYEIKWSDEAIDHLTLSYKDINEIEDVIKRALTIAINSAENKRITISPSYLFSTNLSPKKEIDQAISIRYQRTHSLLDRYEEAAHDVIKQKLSLTGANLGSHLHPSISAAAISDAIRKHASKIVHLLNKYPSRWSILRTHFRPIQNKIINQDILDQLAS